MKKFAFSYKYLFISRDGESPDILALLRNLDFHPSRITVKPVEKDSIKASDSLNEVRVTSVIFYR